MGQVLSFRARLSKLRAMSRAEIAHRARYAASLWVERRASGRKPPLEELRAGLSAPLRHEPWPQALLSSRAARAGQFFPGLRESATIRRVLEHRYPSEMREAIRHADAAARHEFEFLGRTFTLGREIDWHADPTTQRRWPVKFHAEMPVHGGDVGFGDVKYVWELNRHQFLIDLGKALFWTGEMRYLDEIVRTIRSWTRANPRGLGVNWACALEPAFRSLSWLWAYQFSLLDRRLDESDHLLWLAAFRDHGLFLHRHLELYASPYNHLTLEAAALYAIGVTFPEFDEAGDWRRRGRHVLEDRAGLQFHEDGGSVEQSTFYHHATLGGYLLAAILGRAHGEEFSAPVWTAIERAVEFSMAVIQPDGRVPPIGGADDGKPIRLEHLPFWDFRPYLAIGAVLFDRGDLKQIAGRFYEDALWLLGPSGLERFAALDASVPAGPSRALEGSGYFVMRSDWSATADYVLFDCGEQAAGIRTDDIPSAAHGHADCLSVIVSLGGRPVLVDPGFYCYNLDPAWEVFFRKTEAHNTACIDRQDQSRHVGKMAWSHGFRPRLEGRWTRAPEAWVSGSHDGYARGAAGVLHRRTVWLRPDRTVAIHDEFAGAGEHLVELNFQFAPGVLRLDRGTACLDGRVEIGWTASAGAVEAQAIAPGASEAPESGWIATSLGVRRAAPRLKLAMQMSGGHLACLTVLADCAVTRMSSRVFESPDVWKRPDALVVGVRNREGVEWILAGPRRPISVGPFSSDAAIAAFRHAGGVTECAWAQGTYARLDGTGADELLAGLSRAAVGAHT
jgi:hypothetical protein